MLTNSFLKKKKTFLFVNKSPLFTRNICIFLFKKKNLKNSSEHNVVNKT